MTIHGDFSHLTEDQRGWIVVFDLMCGGASGIAEMAKAPARWFSVHWDGAPEGIRAMFCLVLFDKPRMYYGAFQWELMPPDLRALVADKAGRAARKITGVIADAQTRARAAA